MLAIHYLCLYCTNTLTERMLGVRNMSVFDTDMFLYEVIVALHDCSLCVFWNWKYFFSIYLLSLVQFLLAYRLLNNPRTTSAMIISSFAVITNLIMCITFLSSINMPKETSFLSMANMLAFVTSSASLLTFIPIIIGYHEKDAMAKLSMKNILL